MSSKHATSRFHLDTDGLATESANLTGEKLWILARPPGDGLSYDSEPARFRNAFMDHSSTAIRDGERYEAVLVKRGSAL